MTTKPPPQQRHMDRRSQLWPPTAIDLPRALAWLSKPLMPLVERYGKKVPRRGRRGFAPADVLLPAGYRAEVIATGLSAPVMTTFGPDGAAYVVESGHKVDDPPGIRRVDIGGGMLKRRRRTHIGLIRLDSHRLQERRRADGPADPPPCAEERLGDGRHGNAVVEHPWEGRN